MSVYLLIVSDIIPETSDYVPKLGIYYISVMAIVAGSLTATAVTLRCHFNRHKPSNFVLRLFSCKTANVRRVASTSVVVEDLTSKSRDHHISSDVIDEKKTEEGRDGIEECERLREEWKECWIYIAQRLDGFFLVAFLAIFFAVNVGILLSRG